MKGDGTLMRLMTKEIEEKLSKSPFSDECSMDSEVVVKYFNPTGHGTWLIIEGQKQEDGDWMLFGYCHVFEAEWGYVMLSELEDITLPFGLGIERDLHISPGSTVKELKKCF